MQLKKLLISATLITQTIQAAPRLAERGDMMRVPQKAINQMIKNEAKQIQSGLRALELNKELSVNHFTREQLNVVKRHLLNALFSVQNNQMIFRNVLK